MEYSLDFYNVHLIMKLYALHKAIDEHEQDLHWNVFFG